MEEKKELSIIVPIYKVEQYLVECLESLYALALEKEIILVEDASPDSCSKIMEEYQKRYPKETKILHLPENRGLAYARNAGFELAEGDYVFFVDSDDSIDSQQFTHFFEKRKDFEEDIDILHGNAWIYEDGSSKRSEEKIHSRKYSKEGEVQSGKDFVYRTYEERLNQEVVWLNVYRREFLQKNQRSFEGRFSYEDTMFSLPTFWKAEKILVIDIPFYYYRKRRGSITSEARKYMDYLYVYHRLLAFILEEKIENAALTAYYIARVRSFAQKEKVFQEEMYKQLLSLPKKNSRAYRHLLELGIRRAFCRKIAYQDLMEVGKRR